MKKTITLFCILTTAFLHGQTVSVAVANLDENNVGAMLLNNGSYFWDFNSAKFECPKGSGINDIFESSMWLSAEDTAGNLKMAAITYPNGADDFFFGPVSNNYDNAFEALYNRVSMTTKPDVDFHRQHYTDSGYVMPQSVAGWQGNGRTSYGESGVLAPFSDVNHNGIYDPQSGDYPLIRGDRAVFMVINDDRFPHTASGGMKLGAELKIMFYEYDTAGIVNNTVFMHIEITNKSKGKLRSLKFSNYVDIDLGCYSNDFVGCDTSLNLFFGYNGTPGDANNCSSGASGYGSTPVSIGIASLCDNLSGFTYFVYGGNAGQNAPGNAYQFRYYQDCKWADGSPLTYGGTGYGGTTPTCYAFSGDVTNAAEWSEVSANASPGDRRAVGTYNLPDLSKDSTAVLDLAYFLTIDSSLSTNNFTVTNLMKQQSQLVKSHFLNNQPCHEIMSRIAAVGTTGIGQTGTISFAIFPNPSNGKFTLASNVSQGGVIEVYNITGEKVFVQNVSSLAKASFDISNQAQGVYLVKILNAENVWTEKVVVE